jgi:predicted nucleotidyltransferase
MGNLSQINFSNSTFPENFHKMSHLIQTLTKNGLIQPPPWMADNLCYLTIAGSHAYGVADTSVKSKIPDYDYYGFCIPPKAYIFPKDEIPGFGDPSPRFDQWQKPHVLDKSSNKEYDFTIFSIVKFFELARGGNPNILDSLYTPLNCVVHSTKIGQMVRDNRHLFISKNVWARYRGYAYSQLHKMDSKNPEGGRKEIVELHGYDTKFAYHLIRLLDQAQQLIETGDMDIQRARETMKAIRRGEWTQEQVRQWAGDKERELDIAFTKCDLPTKPDTNKLKTLLLACLEEHYGSLHDCIEQTDWEKDALKEIDAILDKHRKRLYG